MTLLTPGTPMLYGSTYVGPCPSGCGVDHLTAPPDSATGGLARDDDRVLRHVPGSDGEPCRDAFAPRDPAHPHIDPTFGMSQAEYFQEFLADPDDYQGLGAVALYSRMLPPAMTAAGLDFRYLSESDDHAIVLLERDPVGPHDEPQFILSLVLRYFPGPREVMGEMWFDLTTKGEGYETRLEYAPLSTDTPLAEVVAAALAVKARYPS